MENIDLAEIHRSNTSFLCRHFFDTRVRTPFETAMIYPDEVDALKKSIEILKCGQYSKPQFKNRILEINAVPFWDDLFLLEHYSAAKERTIKSIEKEQTQYDSDPDKDDFLTKHNFEQWLQDKQQKIKDIINIIELTTEFRTLLNEAFPYLENEFKLKLQEHNEQNKSETKRAAKTAKGKKSEVPEKDLSNFDELFIMSINEEQKEKFKGDINTFVDGYTKNQIVALASLLHGLVHQNVRPTTFTKWLKVFCAIIGKETPTAKQSNSQVREEIPKMKKAYYYLFPKNSLVLF